MKLDYTKVLVNFDGEPFKDEKSQDMTLGFAIKTACRVQLPSDEQLSWQDKIAVGEIGMLVSKGLELTVEQVATVKERSAKIFLSPELAFVINQSIENN